VSPEAAHRGDANDGPASSQSVRAVFAREQARLSAAAYSVNSRYLEADFEPRWSASPLTARRARQAMLAVGDRAQGGRRGDRTRSGAGGGRVLKSAPRRNRGKPHKNTSEQVVASATGDQANDRCSLPREPRPRGFVSPRDRDFARGPLARCHGARWRGASHEPTSAPLATSGSELRTRGSGLRRPSWP
jgi:hypothetical protein